MELVQGPSVQQLTGGGPLPAPALLDIGEQATAGLAHIHTHGEPGVGAPRHQAQQPPRGLDGRAQGRRPRHRHGVRLGAQRRNPGVHVARATRGHLRRPVGPVRPRGDLVSLRHGVSPVRNGGGGPSGGAQSGAERPLSEVLHRGRRRGSRSRASGAQVHGGRPRSTVDLGGRAGGGAGPAAWGQPRRIGPPGARRSAPSRAHHGRTHHPGHLVAADPHPGDRARRRGPLRRSLPRARPPR